MCVWRTRKAYTTFEAAKNVFRETTLRQSKENHEARYYNLDRGEYPCIGQDHSPVWGANERISSL